MRLPPRCRIDSLHCDGGSARGCLECRFAEPMSRTMRRLSPLLLIMILTVLSLSVSAQTRPQNLEPVPDIPPPAPPTLPLAPGQEPEVRIIQRERDKVEEYRIGGQLYMIKVTPPGGIPYFLVDHFGDGNFARTTSTLDIGLRVPMWVIRSW